MAGSGVERAIVPLVEKATVLPLFVFADKIAARRDPVPELLVFVTVYVAASAPVAQNVNGRANPRRYFFIGGSRNVKADYQGVRQEVNTNADFGWLTSNPI